MTQTPSQSSSRVQPCALPLLWPKEWWWCHYQLSQMCCIRPSCHQSESPSLWCAQCSPLSKPTSLQNGCRMDAPSQHQSCYDLLPLQGWTLSGSASWKGGALKTIWSPYGVFAILHDWDWKRVSVEPKDNVVSTVGGWSEKAWREHCLDDKRAMYLPKSST